MTQQTDRIANLSPEKLALLAMRFKKEKVGKPAQQMIPPRDVENRPPLSHAQQRLWFIDQLEPESAAYNMPAPVRLGGKLDLTVLERSMQEIVRRHEILRTTFVMDDGQPVQLIAPTLDLPLSFIDLEHLPPVERMEEAKRLASEEGLKPFDLSTGPLLRVSLLRLCEDDHAILLTMHHIISDGWSFGIFFRELRILYHALLTGAASPLSALPIQYADYAHWQREWLNRSVMTEQLAYWRQQLAGAPAMLELATDFPRPQVQSSEGALVTLLVRQALTAALKDLSQREEVTLFMTTLAALQCLLHYYTGAHDIVVGTNVANRTRPETEVLIGLFINQLVLRTDLSGDPTFCELLKKVREVALGAYAHQHVPFEKVVDALRPERNLSRQPLFQVKLDLQNAPVSALQFPGFTLRHLDMEITVSHSDLMLSMLDSGHYITGFLQYSTDLFTASTAQRMLDHYMLILERVAESPTSRLSELMEMLAAVDACRREVEEEAYKDVRLRKLKNIRRRAVGELTVQKER
ncbi:MAG: condensation domain-containing protein [Pyrinomonadaceae bacterium]